MWPAGQQHLLERDAHRICTWCNCIPEVLSTEVIHTCTCTYIYTEIDTCTCSYWKFIAI